MLKFIKKENKKNLILFIHGFIGGLETWFKEEQPTSFVKNIIESQSIKANYDVAAFYYFTRITDLLQDINWFLNFFRKKKKKRIKRNIPIDEISNLLFSQVEINLKQYENIVLIGHSMGGLVSKSYILKSLKNNSTKVKLFISLATPHNGSDLATISKAIIGNPQVEDLRPLGDFISKLNREWIGSSSVLPQTVYHQGSYDKIVTKNASIGFEARKELEVVYSDRDHFGIVRSVPENDVVVNSIIQDINELGSKRSNNEYNIFIAGAMAGLDEDKYIAFQDWITDVIIPKLKSLGYERIYYAGQNKDEKSDFGTPQFAFQRDYAALSACDNFLLIYPEKVLSSIFIELGIAIEKRKGITLLIRDENHLPFLARELDSVDDFGINIIKYYNDDTLIKRIEGEHEEIFIRGI